MKGLLIGVSLLIASVSLSTAQDLIKGLPKTVTLVKKSSLRPSMPLKDGSTIGLVNKPETGMHVILSKNGKTTDFCDPMQNALSGQIGEVDIEKDGRLDVVVVTKTSPQTIDIKIFKKPEFETLYQLWSSFTGVSSVEFPGNGTVKLYDLEGKAGIYKLSEDGKITEL